jgi:putative ABC transport system permease protein
VVDQSRLVSTGFWRKDFATTSLPALVADLSRPFTAPKVWRGAELRMTVTTKLVCCGTVAATLQATGPDGHEFTRPLGRLVPGSHVLTVSTPECAAHECTLRGLQLGRDAPGVYSVVGQLTLTSLDAGRARSFHPVDGATDPGNWAAIDPVHAGAEISGGPGDLRLNFAAPSSVRLFGLTAKVPTQVAAVVTSPFQPTTGTKGYQITLPSGVPIPVEVTGVASVLPRAGTNGIMLPLDMLAATRSLGDDDMLPNQVWLTDRAAANFPAQLAAAGIPVLGVESATERAQSLARQGPALAVVFLLVGAIAAALLAVAVAMVSLYLIARRRSFELAALRALGFGPRKVLAAAVAEQSILAAFAIGLGVTLGVLGARLGLPSIPEFADGGTVPTLLIRLDPERILAVAGLMSALLGVGIAVSGRLLTSSARPVRLREGQA